MVPRISVGAPFPAERLAFLDRDGRPLAHDDVRSLDDLAHIRAVATAPKRGRWTIDLKAEHASFQLAELPDLGSGLHEMSLEPLQSAVSAALAASTDLDYEVQLRLERDGAVGGGAPTCKVRRYGATVATDTRENVHHVLLDPNAADRFGDAVLASLRAEAVPLAEPDRAPTELPSVGRGRWSLDDAGLGPGAWLVLVYQNDYLRTRPRRITLPGAAVATAEDPITSAMRIRRPDERAAELDRRVAALDNDTTGPGWHTIQSLLSTLGRYPAGTFDPVRSVTRCGRVAALSLLDAGPNAPALWSSMEDLPFLWAAILVTDWLNAIRGWMMTLRSHLRSKTDAEIAQLVSAAAPAVFGDRKPAKFLYCIHETAFLSISGLPSPRNLGCPPFATRARARSP